jgi:hypothetical protein
MISKRQIALCTVLTLLPASVAAQSAGPVPIWAKPDLFWYRMSVPDGNVWVKVDAEHGAKEPLFDHQRLAIELSLESRGEFEPLTLPFADPAAQFVVKYDGSNAYIQQGAMAIEFVLAGNQWRCDLQIKWNWNLVPPTDYECVNRGPAVAQPFDLVALQNAPRVSPDGRWHAFVHEHNIAIRPADQPAGKITVLSKDGTPQFAYQQGSIRWSPDSKSITAYRVDPQAWLSTSVTGNVKKLVAKGEWVVGS